jgi:hypothetical protein
MALAPTGQNVTRDGGNGGSDTINGSQETTFFNGSSSDPPQFRATGLGLNVTHPAFSANSQPGRATANASLNETDGSGKIYLFVDAVKSSWQVQGDYGQAHLSRTFYPHSFVQGPWTIEGQMANQYEYDLLVEFIEKHQRRILSNPSAYYGDSPIQVIGAEFILFRPQNNPWAVQEAMYDTTYLTRSNFTMIPTAAPGVLAKGAETKKFHVLLAITNMEAGHERFRFAPAFTLTAEVIWDYWRDSGYVEFDMWNYFADPLRFLQGVPLAQGPPGLQPPDPAGVNQPSNKQPLPPGGPPDVMPHA